jgi:hypothetical protein
MDFSDDEIETVLSILEMVFEDKNSWLQVPHDDQRHAISAMRKLAEGLS